ncbi:MAG: rod-binding protein [Novosphingobium sp.]
MSALPALSIASTPASPDDPRVGDRKQLADAAKQFEAIFLRRMLAEARKTNFGNDLLSGEGMTTFRQMQDENFAEIASRTGAFGLAAMIEAQLSRHLPQGER